MGETDFDQLHRRIAVLEAENERLQARLREQDDRPGRIATETARSIAVGRDELFTAIEKTRMPMILTDPNQPDNPIIFVNRAFQELSGYDSEELVGRNCRFLQGPDTDPAQVAQIRQALADNTDIAIEILNHRRDGSTFANELYISPVFDRDGQLLYHFGNQLDVTGYSKARRRVKAAERQLRAIFDSAIDIAIVATDRSGRVTEWNVGAEQVLGWSAEEMLGETAEHFFTPEDRVAGRMGVEMRLALEDGRASDERWHQRRDGSRFWASGEMMPLRDESGGHIGFLKVLRDRTTQHEADAALLEQEARLRLATTSARLGTFDYRIQTGELTWDDRCRELFGLPPGVPVSYEGSFLAGLHPEDKAQASETVERSLEPTGSGRFVAEYRTIGLQDGIERWVSANGEALFENGVPTRLIGTVLDITERKRAETALRASEALVRENAERVQLALAAGAIIGTWHWDLPSDCFTVDEGFARSFGLDPALGREGIPLAQIVATVHPDDQAGLSTAINEAIARGGSYAHQNRVRRADGKYHWIEANGRVEHAPDGTPQNFPGVLLDVDQRRAVEAERDRVTAELRALTDTLEQRITERTTELMHAEATLRQSQKMEAVGQLTGGLAHDFNNLLTGVTGSLELLQTRIAQGRIKDVDRYVIAAQGAAKRAAALTHRLLAFSRRQTLDPKPTDVNQLVSGMEDMVRRTVGPEITVDTVGSADLWATLVDPGQLENALLNLCINARDAMPDGGRITVETANRHLDQRSGRERDMDPGDYVSLCVTDTGTGMTPEVVAKALDPFFTTKPIGQGTGLGLSMIYGFTRQSGGQVRIHSEVGKGTTVCLYLPRYFGNAEAAEPTPTLNDAPRAEVGQTVLVVDDEPTVRMLVTDVLEDLGYTAIEAADGASGLKVLRSDVRIDLLVTDVGLPGGMNGRQMADAARLARPELKMLFITGYAEVAVLSHGHLDPGMHVLIKPFAMEALANRIKELLSA